MANHRHEGVCDTASVFIVQCGKATFYIGTSQDTQAVSATNLLAIRMLPLSNFQTQLIHLSHTL